MSSHTLESSIERMKAIKTQVLVNSSLINKRKSINGEDYKREMSSYSFDFDRVSTELANTRPALFFKIQEIVKQTYAGGPGDHIKDKDEFRLETNKLVLSVMKILLKEGHVTGEWIIDNLDDFMRCLMGVGAANTSGATKLCVHFFLYTKTIKNLGTEKHKKYLERASVCEDLGCFMMTELGHGSNVQAIETTATYDHETQSFILNSPSETSIKFWIGNLGKTASKGVVFAHLIVNGENHGVHAFIVPLRDQTNHEIYDGLIIGDCGDKIGLQGVDNGWIKFDNYKIGKDLLLDGFGTITDNGEYTSPVSKKSKRFALQLATLSGGRVLSSSNAGDLSLMALVSAIRFGATRRQFSRSKDSPEVHILDYPLYQARLFPLFAKSFMEMIAVRDIWEEWKVNSPKMLEINDKSATYFHCLTCIMKPVTTWNAMEAVREARMACGGFGYSAFTSFHELLSTCEVNQTWEGENYVMIQQACKLILKNFSNIMQGKETMKTLEFMTIDPPEEYKFEGSFDSLADLHELLAYKARKLVHESIEKIQIETMKAEEDRLSKAGMWEKHLKYSFIPMGKAYAQHYILGRYLEFLKKFEDSPSSQSVLSKLALLHLHSQIVEDEGFYRDLFTREQIDSLKESCIQLNKEIRPEIVGLTYALPYTDKSYGPIAKENLDPYPQFMDCVKNSPGCFGKPSEWKYLYERD